MESPHTCSSYLWIVPTDTVYIGPFLMVHMVIVMCIIHKKNFSWFQQQLFAVKTTKGFEGKDSGQMFKYMWHEEIKFSGFLFFWNDFFSVCTFVFCWNVLERPQAIFDILRFFVWTKLQICKEEKVIKEIYLLWKCLIY